jgi:hypothetical protein
MLFTWIFNLNINMDYLSRVNSSNHLIQPLKLSRFDNQLSKAPLSKPKSATNMLFKQQILKDR